MHRQFLRADSMPLPSSGRAQLELVDGPHQIPGSRRLPNSQDTLN
jgi:hypothetical protein